MAMPYYQAKQGDCFSSLAKQFGFVDYRTIFDHPQNADLKSLRQNPNILYPGDQVFIPDNNPKQISRPVDQKHRFKRKFKPAKLRVRLENDKHEAYANIRYRLTIDGKQKEGRTTSDGMVDEIISPEAEQGTLDVWFQESAGEDGKHTIQLQLGDLDPVSEIRGIQARLNNLGFDCGSESGVMDEGTELALEDFQRQHNLEVTGRPDEATRAQLRQLHDSE